MVREPILFGSCLLATLAMGRALAPWMEALVEGRAPGPLHFLEPLVGGVLKTAGAEREEGMNWREYASALLLFNGMGILLLGGILMGQAHLPLNPEKFPGMPFFLALNTAVSFVTNTNWQAYPGETTLSPFSQMAGLGVQNFLSAATGLSVAFALIRGLANREPDTIVLRREPNDLGNFWGDLARSTLTVLLPLSAILALLLVSQGVVQTLSTHADLTTLEGISQRIALGPVASQEAIKMLGTNGGGYFNANSAHPFENPTALTNFLEMAAILVLPIALVFAFGRCVGDRRQGRTILGAMTLLFLLHLALVYGAELAGNPILSNLGISAPTSMEGKEIRFGLGGTSLFAATTTAASCGAVDGMHDSLTPLGGLAPLLQILLGEVVYGGVGAGFYGMMLYVILTVFIVGLMVGRTPEYLGKKIERFEIQMAILAILIPSLAVLFGSALAVLLPSGRSALGNAGPHGLSEILYAFASASQNNGSAFGGLGADNPFYNSALALCMLLGRFGVILPVLAMAGNLAIKRSLPEGPGTFPTRGTLFAGLLASVVLIVGALTYLPALSLGPVAEQLSMLRGRLF